MPLKNDRLNRSLEYAKTHLSQYEAVLDAGKIEEKDRRRDPKWRSLNSEVKKVEARLEAVAALNARDEAVANRNSEDASAE